MSRQKEKLKEYLSSVKEDNRSFLDKFAFDFVNGKVEKILNSETPVMPLYDLEIFFKKNNNPVRPEFGYISFQYCNVIVEFLVKRNCEYVLYAIPVNNYQEGKEILVESRFENYGEFEEFLNDLLKKIRSAEFFDCGYNQFKIDKEKEKKEIITSKKLNYVTLGLGLLMFMLFFIFESTGTTNMSCVYTGIYFVVAFIFNIIYLKSKLAKGSVFKKVVVWDCALLFFGALIYFICSDIAKAETSVLKIITYILILAFCVFLGIYGEKSFSKFKVKK